MRFSLLNQFQSGLIGTFLAEKLANRSSNLVLAQTPLSHTIEQVIEQLLVNERLTESDWYYLYRDIQASGRAVSSEVILIATIPLIFLFHDHLKPFEEQLQLLKEVWQLPVEVLEEGLIWGSAIALILREKVHPQQLVSHLLQTRSTSNTPLLEGLRQVQMFAEDGVPLTRVVKRLDRQTPPGSAAIAIALYIFSSTPDDFRLCLLRASQFSSPLTTLLVGVLAGAYNSPSGIPIPWRIAARKEPLGQRLYQLASELFTVWSGVYPSSHRQLSADVAVASSGVIQPRSSLKIISQKEF